MNYQQTIVNLPDIPLSQILNYLTVKDCLNLRLISSDFKNRVDDLHGLKVTFRESDDQEKIDGSKNLRIRTLQIYSLSPRHFRLPFIYPGAVRNLYVFNNIESEIFHHLFNQLEDVRKIKLYGDILQSTPSKFQKQLKAFENVEDIRLFNSSESDAYVTSASILNILDIGFSNLKSLSLDFYGSPHDLTKQVAEKVISFLHLRPKVTTIKLRLQESSHANEEELATTNAQNIIDIIKQEKRESSNVTKFHLYADTADITTWIPQLYSLIKATSINIRFMIRSYQPRVNILVQDIIKHVLIKNSNTLIEIRLGELTTETKNDLAVNQFNCNVFHSIKKLKILKISRSLDDIQYNLNRRNYLPFLCNMKYISKNIQEIIIFDCTMEQSDVDEMLVGMTRLRRISIYASASCELTGITFAHIHIIISQNPKIRFVHVGPLRPSDDWLEYKAALTSHGVIVTEHYDRKITISLCKEGYNPKEYAE